MRAVSTVVLVLALLSAITAWRNAVIRPSDPITVLEAEFRTLAPALPPSGTIGFLAYDVDDERPDRVMAYYVAQYTLAPRVVVKRNDVDFLIAASDALRPGRDERLIGFVPVASSKAGYRLYQRHRN
jgi:hypothetical protein